MTMSKLTRIFALLLLPSMLLLSACDRDEHDDDHFGTVERVEIRSESDGTLYAFWQIGMDDFEGDGVPTIDVGETIALEVLFIDEDDNEAELGAGTEFALGVSFAAGAPANIVAVDVHGDHADIEGAVPGQTALIFELIHGAHADFVTGPLTITVGAVTE